jgi:hypothetical protein
MAPRTPRTIETEDDPINETMKQETQGVADELADVLEGFRGIDQGEIKGILFRIPKAGGKFEWIKELLPPFNMSEIMEDLKNTFGGGDYRLSLMVKGKLRKNLQFSIAADPQARNPLVTETRKDNDMMMLIMNMQQQSSDRMMQMMQAMNTSQMNAAAQSNQSMMQLMTVLIPAMVGGKEKTTDLITAFAAINGQKEGGGLADTLAMLKTAKDLFAPGETPNLGDGEEGLVSQGIKLAGQLIPAALRALPQGGSAPAPQAIYPTMPPQAALPPPIGSQPMVNGPGSETLPEAGSPGTGRFPVLDHIREDVMFLFKRGHSPVTAAEVVLDTLDKAQVTDEQVFELITAFQAAGPGWIDELASEGIDLRSNPEWAFAFLGQLIQLYTSDDGDDDHSERGGGSPADNGNHGEPVADGIAQFVNSRASEDPNP